MQWTSAFSAMRCNDTLFPNDFGDDLFMPLVSCLLNVLTAYAPHSVKLEEEKEFLE